jgi:hypothetical protein
VIRDKAVLPNVERMLTSAAKKRAAEDTLSRARRRGPGFMIIAFATLALGGGALAAIGVWHPLGGGGHHFGSAVPRSEFSGVQEGSSSGVPGPAKAVRRGGPATDVGPGSVEGGAVPEVPAPRFEGAENRDEGGGPPPEGSGPTGPSTLGGSRSVDPNSGNPGHAQQPSPTDPPGSPPPPSTPGPTQTSLHCTALPGAEAPSEPISRCLVTVSGQAGAPGGQVSFEGNGQLSASSCVLSDDGNGVSSSCSIDVIRLQIVAIYGGDAANQPSSGSNFQ